MKDKTKLQRFFTYCKPGILWMLLTLVTVPISFSQNNTDVVLILPKMTQTSCDGTCIGATKIFRELLDNSLSQSNLFKDKLAATDFERKKQLRELDNYFADNRINYFLESEIKEINGQYYINFRLRDKNGSNIYNPNFEFEITPQNPGECVNYICETLGNELKFFLINKRFKDIIKVEPFTYSDPDQQTEHTTVFPEWVTEKLNSEPLTSQIYKYTYVGEKVNKNIDKYYIAGNLKELKNRDSLSVIFLMKISNDHEDKVNMVIYEYYREEDEATKKQIIKKVLDILNNSQ